MLRATARFAQEAAKKEGAPGLEYTACRVFAGEYPTHYIPALDGPEHKTTGLWTSQPLQINYGVNKGRYDYGHCGDQPRGLLRIARQETQWTFRQARYVAYMGLWMTPMALYLNYTYAIEAEGKQNS